MLSDKNHKTIAVFAIIVIFIISVIWSIARSNHLTFDALFVTRILGILIIIMITGIMGGLLAYYREKYKTIQDKIKELKKTPTQTTPANRSDEIKNLEQQLNPLARNLISGICAASVVPLFLTMIPNNTIDKVFTTEDSSVENTLVFIGMCILVSIFSTSFLQSMSNRLNKQLQDVETQLSSQDTRLTLINERLNEGITDSLVELKDITGYKLNILKALAALEESKVTTSSPNNAYYDTNYTYEEIRNKLHELTHTSVFDDELKSNLYTLCLSNILSLIPKDSTSSYRLDLALKASGYVSFSDLVSKLPQ